MAEFKVRRLQPGEGRTISLATICSLIATTIITFTFAKPILVEWIGEAATADIKGIVQQSVSQQLSPVVAANRILLQGEITAIDREIARLEYRQQRGIEWTQQDAIDLVDKRAAIAQRKSALEAFDTAKGVR